MAALSVNSVDLKRRRVDVDRTVAEPDGKLDWKAPKDYERRSVPFPSFLADELKPMMAGKSRDDLVFTAPEGGVLGVVVASARIQQGTRRTERLPLDHPARSAAHVRLVGGVGGCERSRPGADARP
jgi:hypothetical protein